MSNQNASQKLFDENSEIFTESDLIVHRAVSLGKRQDYCQDQWFADLRDCKDVDTALGNYNWSALSRPERMGLIYSMGIMTTYSQNLQNANLEELNFHLDIVKSRRKS
jgi:hypothetical protein